MSRLFSCMLGACLILGSVVEYSNSQDHCNPAYYYNNPAPIWQQMGSINPYQRRQAQPVWTVYSNIPSSRAYPRVPLASILLINQPHRPAMANTWVADTFNQIDHRSTAPAEPNSFGTDVVGVPLDSLDPVASIAGELVINETIEDALSLDQQNSPSDSLTVGDADENLEEANSNGTLETADVLTNDAKQEDESDLAIELAELKELLELKKTQNLELLSEVERLKMMVEKQIVKGIKGKNGDAKTKKMIEEATSKAKKEAAREIANLRKEAERAKNELSKTKEQAKAKQRELLARLETVEAKLKKAANHKHEHESGHAGPEKAKAKSNNKAKSMSLAELAAKKRQQRAKMEAKMNKKAAAAKANTDANQDSEMNRQIERAVGKIKRRFMSKIERAEESNASEKDIERLKSEMNIQIEKMEERIRNRFEKRASANGR